MFQNISCIKEWIDKRLLADDNFLNQSRIIVGELGELQNIHSLICMFLANETHLAEMAPYSYRHANGFDKIVIFSSEEPRYSLRLHIWWPNEGINGTLGSIHNHSWDFSSVVVTGACLFQTFQFTANNEDFYRYECDSQSSSEKIYKLRKLGRCGVECTFDAAIFAGSTYSLPHQTLHTISGFEEYSTSTIILHGDSRIHTSEIISRENITANERLVRAFSPDILRVKLQKYKFLLENEIYNLKLSWRDTIGF